MDKKTIGALGVIFGGLFLSLECYLLIVVQYIDRLSGSFFPNVWEYAKRFPCNAALLVTIGVVAFSVYLLVNHKKQEN